MFKRNFLLYVFRILLNNDPQHISFKSAKKIVFGNMSYTPVCMESLIISLHGNVNNSKSIKKIPPAIRPATSLPSL